MKHNWEYKKLGEVVSFIGDGDWIESRHQSDNGIRLIQTGNIGNGVFKAKEDRPHFISESTFDELGCTEIYEGDCLVSRLPDPIGRACIIPNMQNRMITAVDCSILRFQKLISSNFFVYYTRSKRYNKEIENYTTGSTRKRISRRNLESVQVPVPPLSEQSRIVAELDLLTGIIDKQNAQLKELDNLAQAIFYDMFGDPIENPKGWDICHFSDICEVTSSKRVYQSEWQKTGVPFLRISDFSQLIENKSELNAELFISRDKYDELKLSNQVPNKGDILVTARGTLGSCYIIKSNDCFYFQDGMITWLKSLSPNVEPIFIVYLFKDSSFRRQIDKNQSGSTVAYLSISMLKKFTLPVPPLALQQSFAEKIQSIEKQKETIRASIADTQKLLDYTMDKYFG